MNTVAKEAVLISGDRIREIARTCHEANKALCEAFGDDSQKPWEQADIWQRDSAINGVLFHLNNPDAGPDSGHENWRAEKLAAGWVHGESKNASLKTHPCLVPFACLPPEQRAKDHVFRALVHAMANATTC